MSYPLCRNGSQVPKHVLNKGGFLQPLHSSRPTPHSLGYVLIALKRSSTTITTQIFPFWKQSWDSFLPQEHVPDRCSAFIWMWQQQANSGKIPDVPTIDATVIYFYSGSSLRFLFLSFLAVKYRERPSYGKVLFSMKNFHSIGHEQLSSWFVSEPWEKTSQMQTALY